MSLRDRIRGRALLWRELRQLFAKREATLRGDCACWFSNGLSETFPISFRPSLYGNSQTDDQDFECGDNFGAGFVRPYLPGI